ncbi:hypothetical protein BX616_004518 [Lobosporangium transversale]|nr:hypothetical protein BX616_004518 [Lobosporangium transversale]
MKMVDIWGYKLAEHSNEHGIRSAYKSSHHQCILQDSSYYGCLEITGIKKAISDVFAHMLDPTTPSVGSLRYVTGKRQFTAYLYEFDSFPQKMIAPATFLWRQSPSGSQATDDSISHMDIDINEGELSKQGQLWIWIHPSAFEDAKAKIQEAISKVNSNDSGNKSSKDHVQMKDLENSLVMFDFTGPRSTALLQAVLKPTLPQSQIITTNNYEEAHKAWDVLSTLRTSSSLPPGVVLGLLVDDPRLTFPHKTAPRPTSPIPISKYKNLQNLVTTWPSNVAHSMLWEDKERDRLLNSLTPEAKLNERRAQLLVPGTKLAATESDPRIPILLMQREGKPHTRRAPGGGSSEFECGWTLILPKGWGMPFWKSFIFAGARPGGTRERRSFHFETRQSCFPYDFPSTTAYSVYAEEFKKEAEAKYSRKPIAKRINYSKIGVQDPFGAVWPKALKAGVTMLQGSKDGGDGVDDRTEDKQNQQQQKIWLLQTPKLITALTETSRASASNGEDVANSRELTIETLNQSVITESLQGILSSPCLQGMKGSLPRIEDALVRVGVDFLGRGTIGMNGMIYAIPEKHYQEWATYVQLKGKRTVEGRPRKEKKEINSWMDSDSEEDEDGDEEDKDVTDLEMAIPPPETLLGYVTTGQYCYSEGKSYGIACCSATGLAHVIEAETRQRQGLQKGAKAPKMMVLVRSIRSKVTRLAKLTILS